LAHLDVHQLIGLDRICSHLLSFLEAMKLTQRKIELLECPDGRRDMMVFDDEQTGLGVRVTASGRRTFLAQYTFNGTKRRVPLGPCSAISLNKTRGAVRVILGDVAKGTDPASERKRAVSERKQKAAADAFTLEVLLSQWQHLHLAGKRRRYEAEAVRALRFAFSKHLSLPAADLQRGAVVQVIDALARAGHTAIAGRTAAYGRAAYHWAAKRGSLGVNPFSDLPLAPTAKRDRVLSDAEVAAIWRATEEPGAFASIVRMLILTGQRREEVAGISRGEISDDLSTWTIPANRAKNSMMHVVPLSAQARALLSDAGPIDGKSLIFPGLRGSFNGFGKAKAHLDNVSGVADWRLHDLRRTVATGLQRLGVPLEVTEAILNHVSGNRAGIVGIFQRHDYEAEKRDALAKWGAYVAAITKG
jgi:integrase